MKSTVHRVCILLEAVKAYTEVHIRSMHLDIGDHQDSTEKDVLQGNTIRRIIL
jgi:endonuclease/exonuclease/phosphatase family metal-dependent hydrolase